MAGIHSCGAGHLCRGGGVLPNGRMLFVYAQSCGDLLEDVCQRASCLGAQVASHVGRDRLDAGAALEVAEDESTSLLVVELVEGGVHECFALLLRLRRGESVVILAGSEPRV